jgi:hypothetical protein
MVLNFYNSDFVASNGPSVLPEGEGGFGGIGFNSMAFCDTAVIPHERPYPT